MSASDVPLTHCFVKVSKIQHNNKDVLLVDYSNCRGKDLIDVFEQAKAIALTENRVFAVLNIVNSKTFISPQFMRHVEQNLLPIDRYIDKQAIIGLSNVQNWILRGLNTWYDRKIYPFKSREEALDFLTGITLPDEKI